MPEEIRERATEVLKLFEKIVHHVLRILVEYWHMVGCRADSLLSHDFGVLETEFKHVVDKVNYALVESANLKLG
jgi:hypothetical protein